MDAFFTRKRKKLKKDIIFLKAHKYSEIHYLQSKFPSVTVTVCYCLVNLGHTLYILYHLTFVLIVWLYAIMDLVASALGLVGKITLKQWIKNKVNCCK